MKTKLLKKFRKRYKWKYVSSLTTTAIGIGYWEVYDTKRNEETICWTTEYAITVMYIRASKLFRERYKRRLIRKWFKH